MRKECHGTGSFYLFCMKVCVCVLQIKECKITRDSVFLHIQIACFDHLQHRAKWDYFSHLSLICGASLLVFIVPSIFHNLSSEIRKYLNILHIRDIHIFSLSSLHGTTLANGACFVVHCLTSLLCLSDTSYIDCHNRALVMTTPMLLQFAGQC